MSEPTGLTPTDQPQPPLNADLAGYPDVPTLVNGYRASSTEAQKIRAERDQLQGLLGQILAANPRAEVPDRRSKSPQDRLTEFGVPVDALTEHVQGIVRDAFQPLTQGMSARGRLVSEHPDYVKFEQDVANFIASDPELSTAYPKMFESAPAQALEYAFLKFGESRRRTLPTAEGRVGAGDAAIPSSRSGEGRREPDTSGELQQAFEAYQRSGSRADAEKYAKIRLRGVISDGFLNS